MGCFKFPKSHKKIAEGRMWKHKGKKERFYFYISKKEQIVWHFGISCVFLLLQCGLCRSVLGVDAVLYRYLHWWECRFHTLHNFRFFHIEIVAVDECLRWKIRKWRCILREFSEADAFSSVVIGPSPAFSLVQSFYGMEVNKIKQSPSHDWLHSQFHTNWIKLNHFQR